MENQVIRPRDIAKHEKLCDLIGKEIRVLDTGFIRVVDYMGNDGAIVQAARQSFSATEAEPLKDEQVRRIIRRMLRSHHTSPFEQVELKIQVKVPMDTWRQWIRHRTACLSGRTLLHFDLPGGIERRGNQLYKLRVSDAYKKFIKRTNEHPLETMHLRCLNEDTHAIQHTHITDIWESGVKTIYRVELDHDVTFECSKDHLCLTNRGWLRLKDLIDLPENGKREYPRIASIITAGPGKNTGVVPYFPPIDEGTEHWKPIPAWEEWYEVSNQGRVRRIVGGQGSCKVGYPKRVTVSKGRAVVSLNRPGKQETHLVPRLVLFSFVGEPPKGFECCHNDGNALNNRLENLRWDTTESNAQDKIRDTATTALQARESKIISIEKIGEEMTYDLEVEGPWHNFSAGGAIVHNSVNEFSTRFAEHKMDARFVYPGEWRTVGSSLPYVPIDHGAILSEKQSNLQSLAREVYKERLEHKVEKGIARKDLPLSTYTMAFWKIDGNNLLKFLFLRMDKHAQWEIRQYANTIGELVKVWLPHTWGAFEDYKLNALTFSSQEKKILGALLSQKGILVTARKLVQENSGMVDKEKNEFLKKLESLFSLPAGTQD